MPNLFVHDDHIARLALQKDRADLDSVAFRTCAIGYSDEGLTNFEVFQNGYELGRSVQDGQSVFLVEDHEANLAYFFVGTKTEVLAKLRKLPDAADNAQEETHE